MSSARRHGSFASPARASASLIRTTSGSRRSLRTIASVHSAAPATGAFGSERDLGRRALDTARTRGASYADVRLALLRRADAAMRAQQPKLRTTRAAYEIWRESKLFLSSEGADIAQTITETGCSISAESVGDGEQQVRSYPASGGRSQGQFGWEFAERWDLVGNAPRIADEAMALLTATPCPQDLRTTVILSGNQTMLQVHESCGHPIELDRALGTEAAFAGTSFLTPDTLGSLRYGSEAVSMRIDSTTPGGLGTFAYDDEGVPASEGWAVKDGLFVGYLMSRETAAALGKAS